MASTSVFLNVHDIDKSLEFYQALGFKVTSRTRGDDGRTWWADLDLSGAELGLGFIGANDDPEYRAWVGTPLGAGVVAYVTVRDVDRVFARAKKAGAVIEHAPQDRSYGRVFTLNDPDGYVVAFIREPARRAPAAKKAKAAKKAPRSGGKAKTAKRRR